MVFFCFILFSDAIKIPFEIDLTSEGNGEWCDSFNGRAFGIKHVVR